MKLLRLILFLIFCCRGFAAEVIPPKPARYFNDYAHVVSADTAERLNRTLEDFERESSSQIVVAVFPKMQSDSSVEDYTVRVAREWKVGQQDKNNGAVLFVFIRDRKMYVQVGYGLEGVLPDAICKRIIEEQISPRFKAGDFDGGLTAGVQGLIAAAKGEYTGTGRTVAEGRRGRGSSGLSILFFIGFFLLVFLASRSRRRRGVMYGGGGWTSGGWGGGGGGGGGFSGGGFSGGGGSFGGGGAGGSW